MSRAASFPSIFSRPAFILAALAAVMTVPGTAAPLAGILEDSAMEDNRQGCDMSFTYGEGLMSRFIYDGGRYMLSSFIDESVPIIDADFSFWIPCAALKPNQKPALDKLANGKIFSFWRMQLTTQVHYNDNRSYHHKQRPIPDDLATFAAWYSFASWPVKFRVKNSTAKNRDRQIFRGDGMSVAQTVEKDKQGREFIRETEIIVQRENDANHSFYVYDRDGRLANETEGVNGKADAPFVCMACHYDVKNRLFNTTVR